jgi:hypothetical protein
MFYTFRYWFVFTICEEYSSACNCQQKPAGDFNHQPEFQPNRTTITRKHNHNPHLQAVNRQGLNPVVSTIAKQWIPLLTFSDGLLEWNRESQQLQFAAISAKCRADFTSPRRPQSLAAF